jgi:rhamnosyltransferase
VALETPPDLRTAVVVVVYRPQHPLQPMLEPLCRSVATVLVVDNSEAGNPALHAAAQAAGAHVITNANRGALAGAYNAALAFLHGPHGHGVERVVFLDDDSDPSALQTFLGDPDVARRLSDPHTAAVAPAYRDRATGLRGKYIELGRFRLRYLPRQFHGLRQVAFVINSMSVWRRAALERIGRFHEGLAIDHVDTEYCLRARRAGLALWVHGDHEFAHAIGQRRRFRFLGREMQAGGHGPRRRYLIGRNTAWLARTWVLREPAFAFLCLTRLAYEVVGIAVAEDDAGAKLAALLRGALRGLFALRLG